MTALRNLGTANDAMAKSINRLSTGLRINDAADDPAGLIISEGMRSQLKGISQAIMNAQDAVNMSKTAEGALQESQRLLTDIRGIAVHAANSAVVDSAQLQADQNEIKSVLQSLDRIANTTGWGSKKLLNGSAGISVGLTDTTDIAGVDMTSTFNGLQVSSGLVTINKTTNATQTSLTTNKTFASPSTITSAGNIVINGYTFNSNGSTDTMQSMVDKINAASSNTGVTASIVTSGPNYSVKLTNVNYGSQFGVNYFDATGVLSTTANPSPTVAGVDAVATVTATVLNPNGTPTTATVTFQGGQGTNESGLRMTDGQGNFLTLTPVGNAATSLTTATAIGTVTAGNVRFQIGPDSSQAVTFSMPDARTTQLGTGVYSGQSLATLDVTTQAGATQGIEIIDQAVKQLAQIRSNLGSFQKNFLESTLRSLDVANENLTATESTIRDVDMASEMTTYTKTQILQQSGMSVLAQANAQPQQILKLLQSS